MIKGDIVQIEHYARNEFVGTFRGKIIKALSEDSYLIRWRVDEGKHKGEYNRVFTLDELTGTNVDEEEETNE